MSDNVTPFPGSERAQTERASARIIAWGCASFLILAGMGAFLAGLSLVLR